MARELEVSITFHVKEKIFTVKKKYLTPEFMCVILAKVPMRTANVLKNLKTDDRKRRHGVEGWKKRSNRHISMISMENC